MTRKTEIRYIRYYTDGSAARQLEVYAPRKKKPASKPRAVQKKRVVRVDPLALGGIVVSAVMLVLMIVGSVQLHIAQAKQEQMRQYVAYLQTEHNTLTTQFYSKCDLEKIEDTALSMGMIPADQAKTITLFLEEEPVEELTLWEQVEEFFQGLFA